MLTAVLQDDAIFTIYYKFCHTLPLRFFSDYGPKEENRLDRTHIFVRKKKIWKNRIECAATNSPSVLQRFLSHVYIASTVAE